MTAVIRSKNKNKSGCFNLSPEARKRAREYLKSLGYQDKELQPIVWPDDAVSASRRYRGAPWQFTTKADIRRQRQERMKRILYWKREYGVVQRKPLYVWVFRCPGWVYEGWYTYIIGTNISCALNFRGYAKGLITQLMQLFPLIEPTLFGSQDLGEWMAEFIKHYQRGTWCGKPQGKAPVWAEVEGGRVNRIFDRAQWPDENKAVPK